MSLACKYHVWYEVLICLAILNYRMAHPLSETPVQWLCACGRMGAQHSCAIWLGGVNYRTLFCSGCIWEPPINRQALLLMHAEKWILINYVLEKQTQGPVSSMYWPHCWMWRGKGSAPKTRWEGRHEQRGDTANVRSSHEGNAGN